MRDGLIVICMTVVALALGIGLHLQLAMTLWLAVVAALTVYVALLSTHVLVRRSEQVDGLRRELARLQGKSARPAAMPADGYVTASGPGAYRPPALDAAGRGADQPPPPVSGGTVTDYWSVAPSMIAMAGQAGPGAPVASSEPSVEEPIDAGVDAHHLHPRHAPANDDQRTADAEKINAVIKKLAADITQGQAALEHRVEPELPAPIAVSSEIDESVAALHAAADAMRDVGRGYVEPSFGSFDIAAPAPAAVRAGGSPPPIPLPRASDPARSKLAAIADALERERFDVMLEPILGLKDRRAQHYVVSVRLRGGAGDSVAGIGVDQLVPGSGLLPLLDAVKVESAARVAWRMEDRAKPGALFSQLAGESLVSDRFLNRFADTYRQGDTLSGRLVLSFKQAEVRTFSEMQWSTLRDMADLGFRFCLDDITTLDADFAVLGAAGFTFARLDADVFLGGLPIAEGVIPAADICRHFTALGLAVIVAGIADEAVSTQLQSYGVELGHGGLYGTARPVKADVLRNPHSAVA